MSPQPGLFGCNAVGGGYTGAMSWGVPGSEQHRMKIGLLFLILGSLLVVFAWGSWAYRTSTASTVPAITTENAASAGNDPARLLKAWTYALLFISGLALVLLFGGYAVVRLARRYREATERRRPPPTASESVWEMHRVSDEEQDRGSSRRGS